MAGITTQEVGLSMDWGVKGVEYKYDSKKVDFQDLMIAISQKRATTVEGEVVPLSTRIKNRNKELEQLGDLLAIFTQTQSSYDSEAEGSAVASVRGVTEEMIPLACEAYRRKGGNPGTTIGWWNSDGWTKASVEGMLQELKSMIDARNKQVFAGIYTFGQIQPEKDTEPEDPLCVICDQTAIGVAQLCTRLNELAQESGKTVLLLGDGAHVYRDLLEEQLTMPHWYAPAHLSQQKAGSVAVRAADLARQGKLETAAQHRPDYLRVSQAERVRAQRLGQ